MEPFKLGRAIAILSRVQHEHISNELAQFQITGGLLPFMLRIYKNDGITQKEMCESLHIDKTTSAKAIKKLKQIGYLKGDPSTFDRRRENLHLTPQGKKTIPHILKTIETLDHALTEPFSGEEMGQVEMLFAKMQKSILQLRKRTNT